MHLLERLLLQQVSLQVKLHEVQSNNDIGNSELQANHEEADNRSVLHCIDTNANTVTVYVRHMDVLLLLLAHFGKMKCEKLYMMAGPAKKCKFIPVHSIAQ